MHTRIIPEEIKAMYQEVFAKISKDRDRYFIWIKEEIDKVIEMINAYDKIYVLGGLATKLIRATPTPYSHFLENYQGTDKKEVNEDLLEPDDEIELLLEYAMSIATATENKNKGKIPSEAAIQAIRDQLSRIKYNMGMWEISADIPEGGNESDHWLRTNIIAESINVRGNGYQTHIIEIYKELYAPFNDFIKELHQFDADDLLTVLLRLDSLVFSKIGNPFGVTQSHKRLTEWMEQQGKEKIFQVMQETGKHFIMQFTEANPDLRSEDAPEQVIARSLTDISSYNIIYWVIPQSDTERLVFEKLSVEFGDNTQFFLPDKFKAFILNDSAIKYQPLVRERDKFYHFSLNLGFRNIFRITEELIRSASAKYFEYQYQGNTNKDSKDNYVERKTMALFRKLLPTANFYHSLDYMFNEDGNLKKTELDILGISSNAVYIIEVKAGVLTDKHKRGALKGLKDRLEQTVSAGAYQCHRALNYINDSEKPAFTYVDENTRKTLEIDKQNIKSYYKITVTFEHLSSIGTNLRHLISAGVMSEEYKWSWIVSLFDLMVFADLIPTEEQFKNYLDNRLALYEREDLDFNDELDILGYAMEGHFPLAPADPDQYFQMLKFSDEIDQYYNTVGMGLPGAKKPEFKMKI